jgi:hypothetical protein
MTLGYSLLDSKPVHMIWASRTHQGAKQILSL